MPSPEAADKSIFFSAPIFVALCADWGKIGGVSVCDVFDYDWHRLAPSVFNENFDMILWRSAAAKIGQGYEPDFAFHSDGVSLSLRFRRYTIIQKGGT